LVKAKIKKRVLIVGAGGHGKVVLDALLAEGQGQVVGFIDDDKQKLGQDVLGFPVLGPWAELSALVARYRVDCVALAVGDNYQRENLFRRVIAAGLKVSSVIHPHACISRFAKLGQGVVVLAGAVVNVGTIVGDNVCINTRASVDHDNNLAYSCHVFPNATLAGEVRVGEFSYIGSGAVVIPGRSIGRFSYVGAGAVVVTDVAEGEKVVGAPARTIGSQLARPLQLT
jgi:sugar O-acyltransferase (sialic acid O-acetyltransferase NeuD family)